MLRIQMMIFIGLFTTLVSGCGGGGVADSVIGWANLVGTWDSMTVNNIGNTTRTISFDADGDATSNCGGGTDYTWAVSGSNLTLVGTDSAESSCNGTSVCSYALDEPILTLSCVTPSGIEETRWKRDT
ncbi:MAG: hypothetical protein KJ950_10395 [Proteobacteria bacterium]|nr:hypothetical protein [Pseudomonadota bacterium]MBU1687519.1 hypothetical protein [Pseudomonadota bacterium]